MRVLGIADNHDAACALVVDGRLVGAASQERYDRIKNSGHFPWAAIEDVLGLAGLRPADVDAVAFGTTFTPPWLVRRFPRLRPEEAVGHGQFTYLLNLYVQYQSALQRAGAVGVERASNRRLLTRRLAERGFRAPVTLLDHHTAHAESAWRTQPRHRCLVFTADAMGDGLTATVSLGGPEGLRRIASQSGFAALNTCYSRVTEWLGFTPLRHEGKVTGLAALAAPPPPLLAHFRRQLRCEGGRFNRTNYLLPQSPGDRFYRELARWRREEVAAAVQAVVEEAVSAWVAWHVRATGVADIALAGGLFGNVKLNQRLAGLPEVRSLWVFPNMGDGGLAAGAALVVAGVAPHRLPHVLLGPAPVLDGPPDPRATRPADLVGAVVDRLVAGRVVARCDGPMEYGPRALGNRSILVRPDDPSINTTLNARLRRSDFMPFAPMVRAEDAPSLFVGYPRAADAARFMTVCFDCTDRMRRLAPATVHVDGTARPQVVHADEQPALHAILTAFHARTGIPALVNTSFNLHEEPIVRTTEDALRAFREGRLDSLVVGPFLLDRT